MGEAGEGIQVAGGAHGCRPELLVAVETLNEAWRIGEGGCVGETPWQPDLVEPSRTLRHHGGKGKATTCLTGYRKRPVP